MKRDPFDLTGNEANDDFAHVAEARQRRRAEKRSVLEMYKPTPSDQPYLEADEKNDQKLHSMKNEIMDTIQISMGQDELRQIAKSQDSFQKSNERLNTFTPMDKINPIEKQQRLDPGSSSVLPSDSEGKNVGTPSSDTTESARLLSSSDEEMWPNPTTDDLNKSQYGNDESVQDVEAGSHTKVKLTQTNVERSSVSTITPTAHVKQKLDINESPVTPSFEEEKHIHSSSDEIQASNPAPLLEDAPLLSLMRKRKLMKRRKTTATPKSSHNDSIVTSAQEAKPSDESPSISSAPLLENVPIVSFRKRWTSRKSRSLSPVEKIGNDSNNPTAALPVMKSEKELDRNEMKRSLFHNTKRNDNLHDTKDQSKRNEHIPAQVSAQEKPTKILSTPNNSTLHSSETNNMLPMTSVAPNVTNPPQQLPRATPSRVQTKHQDNDDEVVFVKSTASLPRKRTHSSVTEPLKRRRASHNSSPNDVILIDSNDNNEIVIEWSPPEEGPKKNWQVHVDELQYLVDGIFLQSHNKNLRAKPRGNTIVLSSLRTIIEHTLKKPPQNALLVDTDSVENFSPVLQILHEQPKLLEMVLKRLCRMFGHSRAIDSLLSLFVHTLYESTLKRPQMENILGKTDLDSLLMAFFRNCAASTQELKKHPSQKNIQSKQSASAQKGNSAFKTFNSTEAVNKLITKLGIVQDGFGVFSCDTDASSFLLGKTISRLLERVEASRRWMRENRRLDKIVALVYTCDKNFMESWKPMKYVPSVIEEFAEDPQPYSDWIVLGSCIKILDSVTLDPVCQFRLVEETRVCSVNTRIIKAILKLGFVEYANEWLLLNALKLCINLVRLCPIAIYEFIKSEGLQMIIDCLTMECRMSGVLPKANERKGENGFNVEEDSYDTRVLSLALLAIVVYQDQGAREDLRAIVSCVDDGNRINSCRLITAIILGITGTEKRDYDSKQPGGISILERMGRETSTCAQSWSESNEQRSRPERQYVLERRITMGYTSLLIGCLVRNSPDNRKLFEELLPKNSLPGMAAILEEFLGFHHDVGVAMRAMDKMFEEAMMALVGSDLPNGVDLRSTALKGVNQNDFAMDLLKAGGVKTKKRGVVEEVDLEGLEFVEVDGDGDLVDMLYPESRNQEE